MKKILLTGAGGYIGSILSKNLKNFSVFNLDKQKNLFMNNNLNIMNLNSKNLKKDIIKFNPNIVVHLAGQSTIDFVNQKSKYYKNNVLATKYLIQTLKQCNSLERIIFSSTASVYSPQKKNLNENSKIFLGNNYAITKFNSENLLREFSKKYKKKIIIFRFFNVCGADIKNNLGELHNPETHLIPIVVNKICNKKEIIVYGNKHKTPDGSCIRDYIHVRDIVNAIKKSVNYKFKKNFNIFNLGTGKGFSVLQIIEVASKLLKNKPKIKFSKARFGDVAKLVCSSKKIYKSLKWKPINSNILRIIKDEIAWQKYLRTKKIKKKYIY